MAQPKTLTIAGILLAVFLFTAAATNLFGIAGHPGMPTKESLWATRFEFWLALLLLYLFSQKIEKASFLIWDMQKKKALFYVASFLIIVVAVTILLTAISLLEKKLHMTENTGIFNKMAVILCNNKLLLIFTCLTAAFTEELIFRGYLLPRLQILFPNKWIIIFLSSLLFGLAHFGYGDINRMLFPFIIGLIFSYHYYRYRSLAILIVCHFAMDFYSLYAACK